MVGSSQSSVGVLWIFVLRVYPHKTPVVAAFVVDGGGSIHFADVDVDKCHLDLLLHVDEVRSRRLVVQSGDGMRVYNIVRRQFPYLVGKLHYIVSFKKKLFHHLTK